MYIRKLVVLIAFTAVGCVPGRTGGVVEDEADMAFWDPENDDAGDPITSDCQGLECQQMDCGEVGTPTTLTGVVYAPNGWLPLYNAIVYIPNAPVAPFPSGVSCDRCDGQVSGQPIVQDVTKPDGTFTLKNVPAGPNIPIVVQLGKWRRLTTIPNVPACTTTKLSSQLTRLPTNHKEGDMPMMAIATGGADPFECLLLKIGIDPAEIKDPGNGTRVEFYQGANSPGTRIDNNTPSADDPTKGLYTKMSKLNSYDIVILPCEGEEADQSVGAANIVEYVNGGGRVFATHYSYDWLTYSGSPFNVIAQPQTNGQWPKDQLDYPDDSQETIAKLVTNFPKGMAFASWLKAAKATSTPNNLDIYAIRHDINGVNPKYAQAWATDTITPSFGGGPSVPGIAHLTFNTPVDAPKDDGGVQQYCGRVVYSDFHVISSAINSETFPQGCVGITHTQTDMIDQEKALAFMLFDLSSCVQPDTQPPIQ